MLFGVAGLGPLQIDDEPGKRDAMWNPALQANRTWRGISAAAFSLLLLAAIVFLNTPAAAQNSCGPRDAVIELLGDRFDEKTVAVGLASSGGVIEVLASNDGQTWTIMLTTPDGNSCVVASGEAWIDILRRVKGQIS